MVVVAVVVVVFVLFFFFAPSVSWKRRNKKRENMIASDEIWPAGRFFGAGLELPPRDDVLFSRCDQ